MQLARAYVLRTGPGPILEVALAAKLNLDREVVVEALNQVFAEEKQLRDEDVREEWRVALFVIGLAAVAGAIFLEPIKSKDTTSATMLAAGFLLLFAAAFANRIKSFKGAGLELVLSDLQQKAEDVRAASQQLADLATRFEDVHQLPESPVRSLLLKGLVATTQQTADQQSPEDVVQLQSGDSDDRLKAIVVMGARPDLADWEWLREVVDSPGSSNFEVFHALSSIRQLLASGPSIRNAKLGERELRVLLEWIRTKKFLSRSAPRKQTARERTARKIQELIENRLGVINDHSSPGDPQDAPTPADETASAGDVRTSAADQGDR